MDHQDQHSYRRAADEAFFDSLNQLEETLELADAPVPEPRPISKSGNSSEKASQTAFSLADLEQAVQDIEQFFQSQYPESKFTEFSD